MLRLYSLVVVLVTGTPALAGDWPQWLGPTRDSVSPEKIAPWNEAPKAVWRQAVGEGHSSPVVADGKVFLHAKVKDKEEEEVIAFDAQTGKVLWSAPYARAAFSSIFGNGPRATPAVADGKIYTFGATGVLSCYKAKTGEEIWQVDTLAKFKAANLTFGMSCSPLVEGNNVIVSVGAKGASVVAFDRDNGSVLWKNLDDPASYSSPIIVGQDQERQVIFVTQQGVVSLNPADGTLFWKYPMVDLLNESSTTPVKVGDLLLAGSVTYGSVGLRLGSKEGKPSATRQWRNTALTCYFSTPVPVKESVYLVTGTILPPPQATLRCVEAQTGKELWHQPKVGTYHAALLRTGDNKLLLLDDGGNLALLDPSAKEYRELARSKVCGPAWAHPALANGRLYVRDDKELICLQLGE